MLSKLYRCRIRGIARELLRQYLSGRSQRVVVNNSYNNWKNVGVLQESILGPLVFVEYINDLFEKFTKGAVFSFADDTAMFASEQTWEDAKICRYVY